MTTEPLNLTHFDFSTDEDGIATLLMDVQGQKMNTLSGKVSDDMNRVLDLIESDPKIRAVIFGSTKKNCFVAGADIETIRAIDSAAEATKLAASLQVTFERIEALYSEHGKPTLAAIDGVCLGGGLEMALACSMRLVTDSPKTVLGVPEVKLGLFPGAGGTQRLPRLIGIAKALDLILTGKNVRPKKAKKIGLADDMVPQPLLLDVAKKKITAVLSGTVAPAATGMARLKELAHDITDPEYLAQLALEENPVGQRLLFTKAKEQLLKTTKGNYPAPEKALEVLRVGIQEGLAAGYAAEADRFGQMAVTPEARALMSVYFATQELKKDNGTDDPDVVAKAVTKVGVLGGGLMGGGIAAVTAINAGLHARIREIDNAGMARGIAHVSKLLGKDVKRRRRTQAEADRVMQHVTGSLNLQGFESAEVVIEAVFEDLELKRRVLKQVEEATPETTIFASNTSSLPITQIAEASKRPENVIGMHYFSPVEKMPLLEVITTEKTADWVTATCVALGKKQGKTVIVVNDGTGFYTTRILTPYVNEAAILLGEEASIEAIDKAMVRWGFPVGPVLVLDEVGIDVGSKVAKIMQREFGDRVAAPTTMKVLIDDNRLGRKNGRGFYAYENGKKQGVDESVYEVFGQTTKRRRFGTDEIQQRIALAMVNEAALCLQDGVLRSPRDGDIGAIFGLGFPPFLGGPFAYIDQMGAGEILRRLDRLADTHGVRFEPAQIIRDHAKDNKRFRPDIV